MLRHARDRRALTATRILDIDIDTLRPDHLGCHGYHRETTPNIDAIAANGTRFTNVYASDVPCLPSRTALVTGTFGIRNGVNNHGGAAADPLDTIAAEGGPFHVGGHLDEYIDRLRATGREEWIAPILDRHPC